MKKNLIYTVIFLLLGTFSFSSCQDMLNVDSNRVEYEFEGWSPNDSVYSVLGILKSVQGIADRNILLNELRADLIVPSDEKAVVDIQEICNSNFANYDTNKYLDVKDYYTVINNCNIFLKRVENYMSLNENGADYMMPEYVAVKSMRAWTYLQLAVNYNEIPFFTEPILTHSEAQNVMNSAKLSRVEVMDRLIADILPYENPMQYTMPAWEDGGKILTFGYNSTTVETSKLFVPVRMLLGEMYLWKGDYKKAANCFYAQLVGYGTNNKAAKYTDNSNTIKWGDENGKNLSNNYSSLFAYSNYSSNAGKYFAVVPFANSSLYGTTSDLASVFSPQNDLGGSQVFASPGFAALSQSQKYRYVKGDPKKPEKVQYGDTYEYPGDLRIKATTYSQTDDDVLKTEYKNIIAKFNLESSSGFGMNYNHVPSINTTLIVLQRAEHAYLRFAEAIWGLAYGNGNDKEKYRGALELAMTVLKSGVKDNYILYQNPVDSLRPVLNTNGDTVKIKDDAGNMVPKMEKFVAEYSDSVSFDFTYAEFKNNSGIHSRGTGGDAEHNSYYALDSLCVARYLGFVKTTAKGDSITKKDFPEGAFDTYVADLILDELALELSWEGTRFGDLVRFAEVLDDPDILAKRVAGRNYSNLVRYRHRDYKCDDAVLNKMRESANWYLPLPGEAIEPADEIKE